MKFIKTLPPGMGLQTQEKPSQTRGSLLKVKAISSNDSDLTDPIFWNWAFDKGRLKGFVSWFLQQYGEKKTLQLLEQLKELGFGYATKAGISLGIEDLKIPPQKNKLLAEAELAISESIVSYRKGEMTGIEKMQRFIETWNETSEILKQEVVSHFEKTDILNPVYMMAFSGARGNLSQVRQLVGMRGLMSDPQGKIIDFAIQSNFREGLTLTEYLISTYGARKGIVDTALRTATAGYLTRRLVDVAQHVIVAKFDCETQRGIFLFDMKEGTKTIYSFQNRLLGRVLAQDLYLEESESVALKIGSRNQEIDSDLARAISKITKKTLVRSPLTCETRKSVCQLCYGWSLATSRLVSIGEAVGVIAGQSIGEPGTQLTMRTFHTGGVFSGTIAEQINASSPGIVEYAEPIAGTCIRTPQGQLAFFTKSSGTLFFKTDNGRVQTYRLPAFTILFNRHGQFVKKDDLLAQVSALSTEQKSTQTIEQTIYSNLEGEVYFDHIDLLEDIDEKYGERISKAEDWSKVWVLSAKIYHHPLFSNFFPKFGDIVSKNTILQQIKWVHSLPQTLQLHTKDVNAFGNDPSHGNFEIRNFNDKDFFKNASNMMESKSFSKEFKLKETAQIFSKYQLQEKFFNSRGLKATQSPYFYPYEKGTRGYLAKIFSQTYISLPLLQPGILKQWFKDESKSTKRSSLKSFSKNTSVTPIKGIIKKLNLQTKFQVPNPSKPNFFHPLVLVNSVSFVLKRKTLKKSRSLTVFPAMDYSEKTVSKFPDKGDFSLQKHSQTKSRLNKQSKEDNHKRQESKLFNFSEKTQKEQDSSKKYKNFDLETPFLSLEAKNVVYQKYGYFLSIPISKSRIDRIFSFLPLRGPSFLESNQFQSTELSTHTNFLNFKNFDQWSPNSTMAFNWFPNSTSTTGVMGLVTKQSPILDFKTLQTERMETLNRQNKVVTKTKNISASKLVFLNMSQSQNFKSDHENTQNFNKTGVSQNLFNKQNSYPNFMKVSSCWEMSKSEFSLSLKKCHFFSSKDSINREIKIYPSQKSFFEAYFLSNFQRVSPISNSEKMILKELFFHSKENKISKNQKTLNFAFNFNKKVNVPFEEIYWLPQENRILKGWLPFGFRGAKSQKRNSLTSGTSLNNPWIASTKSSFDIYLSNRQGLKKKFQFQESGLLKMKTLFKTLPSSSGNPFLSVKEKSTFLMNFNKHSETSRKDILDISSSEISLKRDLLKYIKTKKFGRKDLSKFKNQFSHSPMIIRPKSQSEFFTFIPFGLSQKQGPCSIDLNSVFDRAGQKKLESKSSKLKNTVVDFEIKVGWVYKPLKTIRLIPYHKEQFCRNVLIDDVSFDESKVFTEIVQLTNPVESLFNPKIGQSYEPISKFCLRERIQNSGGRFPISFENSNFHKEALNSLALLIRPFQSKLLPTESDLKGEFYRTVQATKFKKFENSSTLYEKYFSEDLNLQTKCSKYLSNFSPMNLDLKMEDSMNSSLMLLKTQKNSINSQNQTFLREFSNPIRTQKTFSNEIKSFPNSVHREEFDCFSMTYSNLEYLNLKIFMNVSDKELLKYSFGQIRLNWKRPLQANEKSIPIGEIRNACHDIVSKTLESPTIQRNPPASRMANAFSLRTIFASLPNFQYSMIHRYNCFSNQRTLASSFYRDQYQNGSNFFQLKNFKETLRKPTMLSDSFTELPISMNEFKIQNLNFHLNKTVGFTSFLSPFQGEILKDYTEKLEDPNEQNQLKKGFNVNLENGLLKEKEAQRRILTKSDIFSLKLQVVPTHPKSNALGEINSLTKQKLSLDSLEIQKFPVFESIIQKHQNFKDLEESYREGLNANSYEIPEFQTSYENQIYKLKSLNFGLVTPFKKMRLGMFLSPGDPLYSNWTLVHSGKIIHINSKKMTLRKAEFFSISPKAILHTYNGHALAKNAAVMTLPFETLKTGDIVQGIPKVEQYLEARTTIQGRLFRNSLPVLLSAIYQRYSVKLGMEKAVRQSFLKIQQILVDGIQRVYRSQGISIADKHLEVVVRQMTSKVKIVYGGQTGFFAGELVDLDFVERLNRFLMVKIRYEPVVLGLTRASLEVDSFLSAASFQQTTKVLTRAAIENKRDFLKGLKENLLVGNLLPAGTGYVIPISRSDKL
jgi:hypothetical protein